MRKLLAVPAWIALLTLPTSPALVAEQSAQAPPTPQIGGTVTITPEGVKRPSEVAAPKELPAVTPAEAAAPVTTPPVAPEVETELRLAATGMQPSPPKETVPSAGLAAAPAGAGAGLKAGPGAAAPRGPTRPARPVERGELLPRAGTGLGWFAITGAALLVWGVTMRRSRR